MKKAIIIIVSAVIILAGTFAGLWFFTDVFSFLKPASNNFSTQLSKILGAEKSLSYSEYENELEKLKLGESYTTNFNIKMNVSIPSNYISYSNQKLINSSSLNLKTSYDNNKKAYSMDMALLRDSKDVIKAQAVLDGEKLSINSSDLYSKYLTFDLNKYESFCKQNNIPVDEETKKSIQSLSKMKDLNTNNLAYDLYHISKDDYNNLQKTYDKLFTKLIEEDNYTTKKNQKITVGNDEDVKTTAYSLVLTGKDAYNMTNKFFNLVKNDSTTKKLIVEKYNLLKNYGESYANSLESSDSVSKAKLPDISESDLNDVFSKITEELESSKDSFNDSKKALKITIYSNKSNEPVKLEVEILDDKEDDEGSIIFTQELEKGKNTYVLDLEKISKLSNSQNTTRSSYSSTSKVTNILNKLSQIKIVDEYKSSKESRDGKLTVSAKISGSKFEELLNIDYEYVNSKSEQKTKISASSPLSSAIAFNYEYSITGLDTNNKNMKLSMNAKLSSYTLGIDMDGKLTDTADIPELTNSNSVDMFALSTDEFKKVYSEVINNAANNLPSKLSTYGINLKKENILKLLPAEPTVPQTENTEAPAIAEPSAM